jgi:hypothetical protein
MSSNEEISLEKSLEGFLALHKDILHVKNHGILMRDDEKFKRDSKSVILISGGKFSLLGGAYQIIANFFKF